MPHARSHSFILRSIVLEFDENSRLHSSFLAARMCVHMYCIQSFVYATNNAATILAFPY